MDRTTARQGAGIRLPFLSAPGQRLSPLRRRLHLGPRRILGEALDQHPRPGGDVLGPVQRQRQLARQARERTVNPKPRDDVAGLHGRGCWHGSTGCAGLPSVRPMTGAQSGSRVARDRATRVLAGCRRRRPDDRAGRKAGAALRGLHPLGDADGALERVLDCHQPADLVHQFEQAGRFGVRQQGALECAFAQQDVRPPGPGTRNRWRGRGGRRSRPAWRRGRARLAGRARIGRSRCGLRCPRSRRCDRCGGWMELSRRASAPDGNPRVMLQCRSTPVGASMAWTSTSTSSAPINAWRKTIMASERG